MGVSLQSRPSSSGLDEDRQHLAEVARQLELEVVEQGRAQGQVLGTGVSLELTASRGLLVRARLPVPLPTGLQLTSEQAASTRRLPKGFRDIQVGVPDFDACVHIQAANPAAAIRLLRDEELQRRLPALLTSHPELRVVGEEVLLPLSSSLDEGEGRRVVKEAVALAKALGRASQAEEDRARSLREASLKSHSSPSPSTREQAPSAEELESGKAYLARVRRQYFLRVGASVVLRIAPLVLVGFLAVVRGDRNLAALVGVVCVIPFVLLSLRVLRCPACGAPLPQAKPRDEQKRLSKKRCVDCYISFTG